MMKQTTSIAASTGMFPVFTYTSILCSHIQNVTQYYHTMLLLVFYGYYIGLAICYTYIMY